ncbi:uncharacterized protein [Physcomitrium patens]|uniref:uncharacterized protein n=1 Tax=Physcomitrium patens TaxID=3218 RepID=UPI003CCD0A19
MGISSFVSVFGCFQEGCLHLPAVDFRHLLLKLEGWWFNFGAAWSISTGFVEFGFGCGFLEAEIEECVFPP